MIRSSGPLYKIIGVFDFTLYIRRRFTKRLIKFLLNTTSRETKIVWIFLTSFPCHFRPKDQSSYPRPHSNRQSSRWKRKTPGSRTLLRKCTQRNRPYTRTLDEGVMTTLYSNSNRHLVRLVGHHVSFLSLLTTVKMTRVTSPLH